MLVGRMSRSPWQTIGRYEASQPETWNDRQLQVRSKKTKKIKEKGACSRNCVGTAAELMKCISDLTGKVLGYNGLDGSAARCGKMPYLEQNVGYTTRATVREV